MLESQDTIYLFLHFTFFYLICSVPNIMKKFRALPAAEVNQFLFAELNQGQQ